MAVEETLDPGRKVLPVVLHRGQDPEMRKETIMVVDLLPLLGLNVARVTVATTMEAMAVALLELQVE